MPGVHPPERVPFAGASIRSEPAVALRELLAIREIAHALLQADSPDDVYRFALDRVTPLLGAAFSLVLRLDADGELLRPVAQLEWPSVHRGWIGALRVRVGRGPSGTAVAEGRVVEVEDVFADPASAAWHDIARELGFRSIVAAPLVGRHRATGAVAFYFARETQVTDEQRALVRVVCEQLAATVDKAALIEERRRANGALAEANAELERQAERAARERRGAATDRRAFVRALREAAPAAAAAAAESATMRGPDDAMVPARRTRFDEALMQRLATRLGGHLRHESSGHDDQARSLLVVLPLDAGPAVLDADASLDSISQTT
jgi:GAF domain-containing protein